MNNHIIKEKENEEERCTWREFSERVGEMMIAIDVPEPTKDDKIIMLESKLVIAKSKLNQAVELLAYFQYNDDDECICCNSKEGGNHLIGGDSCGLQTFLAPLKTEPQTKKGEEDESNME